MADLFFHIPEQILFGLDTLNRVGTLAGLYGRRALIVTEAILYEQKTIERIQDLLSRKDIDSIVYDEVVPNATSTCVDEGVKLARSAHIDMVIGLGGMRTLSTAKCIAMVALQKREMDDFLSDLATEAEGNPLPYFEIPTTSRNSFMLVDSYLMVDARDRRARIGRTQSGITKAVIIDPKLTVTLPPKYTATTLMSTLLSAIEGYLSTRSNFLSDTLFERAIELIGQAVSEAAEELEGLKFRGEAAKAGLLAALGLSMSKAGIGSALSYAINARFMVPKSWLATILIPHILEFHASVSAERVARIGRFMGENLDEYTTVDAANKTIETIRARIGSMELPSRLRDFDLKLDDMIEVVETAHSFEMMNHLPRTVSTEDLYDIIKSSF
ncbi:MAG TPA: iron-containing alcohol dehydrogenase [Spirochaetia bacterium]|nr:iron-containing alcohol dehydrogenase [Spirochaetia bacterium]